MAGNRFYVFLLITIITVIIIFTVMFRGREKNDLLNKSVNLSVLEKEWLIENKNKITYINDTAYPPVSFLDKNGNYTGISEDYIHLLESRLEIKFIRLYKPTWRESVELAKNKKVGLIGGIAVTPERMNYLIFTSPYYKSSSIFITRKNYASVTGISDFRFKEVAVSDSYAVSDFLYDLEPLIKQVFLHNDLEGLRKVSFGELDAVVTDITTASYCIEQSGLTNLKIAADTGFEYNLCFGISRSDPVLASIIIKVIDNITEEEKKAINRKWVYLEYEPFFLNRKWRYAAGFLLVVIVSGYGVFITWNRLLKIRVNQKTRELRDYKDNLEMLVNERTIMLQKTVVELNDALEHVKSLRGIVPICSCCKSIRNDKGYWQQIEVYIRDHTDAEFSHSLCPVCVKKLYGEQDWFRKL